MRGAIEEIYVLHGTVEDALKVYPFAPSHIKEALFRSIMGKRTVMDTVRIQVDSQQESDHLRVLSTLASGELGSVHVRSQSRPDQEHDITYLGGIPVACSCESFKFSEVKSACKHMKEVTLRDVKPQSTANSTT